VLAGQQTPRGRLEQSRNVTTHCVSTARSPHLSPAKTPANRATLEDFSANHAAFRPEPTPSGAHKAPPVGEPGLLQASSAFLKQLQLTQTQCEAGEVSSANQNHQSLQQERVELQGEEHVHCSDLPLTHQFSISPHTKLAAARAGLNGVQEELRNTNSCVLFSLGYCSICRH
jgi:hypothetical protein